jgi:hypothetical protein
VLDLGIAFAADNAHFTGQRTTGPAEGYFAKYVREGDGQTRRHPFFNGDPSLSDAERELLRDYRVSYVLTDPEFAEAMALKLGGGIVGTTLEMDQDGYRLYKVNGS